MATSVFFVISDLPATINNLFLEMISFQLLHMQLQGNEAISEGSESKGVHTWPSPREISRAQDVCPTGHCTLGRGLHFIFFLILIMTISAY